LNSTIDKNYGWGVGTDVGFALLLESDASSTYKRLAMKKIIKKKIIIRKLLLTLSGISGNPVWHSHTSHRG